MKHNQSERISNHQLSLLFSNVVMHFIPISGHPFIVHSFFLTRHAEAVLLHCSDLPHPLAKRHCQAFFLYQTYWMIYGHCDPDHASFARRYLAIQCPYCLHHSGDRCHCHHCQRSAKMMSRFACPCLIWTGFWTLRMI